MPACPVKLPHYLKRCARCERILPRTEEHFYRYRPSKDNGRLYFFSRCKDCGKHQAREVRERLKREDPERLRKKELGYRQRRNSDPERYAAHRDYQREWDRQNRPERYRDTPRRKALPRARDLIDPTPIREAVERSEVSLHEIALRLGWFARGGPEAKRVRRSLHSEQIQVATALLILDAINILPVEAGL